MSESSSNQAATATKATGKSKCVALIGSTGGGTATLGHTDPPQLLQMIGRELKKVADCDGISRALFVALEGGKGFDQVDDEQNDPATLYQVPPDSYSCQIVQSATLKHVNADCKKRNKDLADAIRKGEIHGLICISVSVEVFAETLQAASEAKIPVTGTGGTSLSVASSSRQSVLARRSVLKPASSLR